MTRDADLCLPSILKCWFRASTLHTQDMVMHTCNPSTHRTWQCISVTPALKGEARGWEFQGQTEKIEMLSLQLWAPKSNPQNHILKKKPTKTHAYNIITRETETLVPGQFETTSLREKKADNACIRITTPKVSPPWPPQTCMQPTTKP